MKKLSLVLMSVLILCATAVKANTVCPKEFSLTNEQVLKMDEFTTQRMADIKKIEDEIKAKYEEIIVVKNTKIAERFQQEKIAQLNKEIKALKKELAKADKKYEKDFIKTYNSILTKEQAKTMKLKKQIKIFNRPCTLPAYPDNIKKERG